LRAWARCSWLPRFGIRAICTEWKDCPELRGPASVTLILRQPRLGFSCA
jgi:hypothetical protein